MLGALIYIPSAEECKRWAEFVGPRPPSGWNVVMHPDNLRRQLARQEAAKARGEAPEPLWGVVNV